MLYEELSQEVKAEFDALATESWETTAFCLMEHSEQLREHERRVDLREGLNTDGRTVH